MTISLPLIVTIGVLCAVAGWLIGMIIFRPRTRTAATVDLRTRHGRGVLDGSETGSTASVVEAGGYSDLFEQFERAVIEAEYGFERRRSASELRVALSGIDSTTLIAPDDAYEVDSITRAELLELRARMGDS